ncbi:MAG: flagellar biosynthesis protein FlgA [Magnetovibrio sp.]|nr:flagellar biosynthesis protein FlgA [Magnetovibrio sp.]
MNLFGLLQARKENNNPIRVGLIGAGKFGTMFLSQALKTPGIHVVAIADLNPDRIKEHLAEIGWPPEKYAARSLEKAKHDGSTHITDDSQVLLSADQMDVIVEATGNPDVGVRHALAAIEQKNHIVMVNVEADALCGPLLAKKARDANVVYTLAYGDQPALICEQVDWARTCGFEVVAAGKGTLYMPDFHAITPETVWDHYHGDITPERAEKNGMNPRMFTSFIDGTKSGIEMAAVANATGLLPSPQGLTFPACNVEEIATTLIPQVNGGLLDRKGQVEVISSRTRNGVDIAHDLRWGVYVTFEAPSDYVRRCFADYGLVTDVSGRYTALWRPYHLIGLELGVSIAWAALMGQSTGTPKSFLSDVVTVAKRNLDVSEILDGEGGFTVWGQLMPANTSLDKGAIPIGLANELALKKPIQEGQVITWSDVDIPIAKLSSYSYKARHEMELSLGIEPPCLQATN